MNNPKLTSPSEVTRILAKYDFKCKKRLGQNFLVDQNTLQIIINSLQLNKEDRILEIGTGIGTLPLHCPLWSARLYLLRKIKD